MADKERAKEMAKRVSLYHQVFNSPQGQEVLYDLMATHSFINSTFDENPRKMMIREGERNAVLRILHILKQNPKTILERIRQHEIDSQ